jgi:hypothetical protein
MPVTAKLSKLFYDRLGEEIANELVDWFNAVDATYRADLKELNDLNFARFDAKLEQRVRELDAKIDRVAAELDAKIDRVAGELDAKIERVATGLDAKIDRVAADLQARIEKATAELMALLERRLGEQTRWLFVAWASLLIPIIGLWMRG